MDTHTKSEQINELASALSVAQSQMTFAVKDKTNPHFKSDYADLAAVWEAIRKPLADNGLAVSQLPMGEFLHTVLMHKSGQWLSSETPIKCQAPQNPQAYGSGLTYARRYALAAICGIAQDDDDANAASSLRDHTATETRQVSDTPAPDPDSADRQRERIASATGTKPNHPTIIEAERLITVIQSIDVEEGKKGEYLKVTFPLHDPSMGAGREGHASVFSQKGNPNLFDEVRALKGQYAGYKIVKSEFKGRNYINIVGVYGAVVENSNEPF